MTQTKRSNRILGLLLESERATLLEDGRLIRMRKGQVLQEPDDEIESVFFPLAGVVSMLVVLSDGGGVEAAAVGNEGMVGLPVFLGARISVMRSVVQVGGEAWQLRADDFRRWLRSSERLMIVMARYAELVLIQSAQLSACNRLHAVLNRCARAILTWADRLPSGRVPVTQDSLAEALGVRRASVTEALATLTDDGCIASGRGYIQVISRRALEDIACECYDTIHQAYARTSW